jgi:hypothetical protein
LRPGRHVDLELAIARRHFDLAAENGVDDLERMPPPEIRAVTLETRIGLGAHDHVEVRFVDE